MVPWLMSWLPMTLRPSNSGPVEWLAAKTWVCQDMRLKHGHQFPSNLAGSHSPFRPLSWFLLSSLPSFSKGLGNTKWSPGWSPVYQCIFMYFKLGNRGSWQWFPVIVRTRGKTFGLLIFDFAESWSGGPLMGWRNWRWTLQASKLVGSGPMDWVEINASDPKAWYQFQLQCSTDIRMWIFLYFVWG